MDVFFPSYTRLIYSESSGQLWDFVLLCRLIHSQKPSYQVSVRRVRCLPTASFRFHLTVDTLAFGCSLPTVRAAWGLAPVRIRSCWANNRVGGKRSSFLPTFVFRPLTPPYVPFGIRRFFNYDAISLERICFQKLWVCQHFARLHLINISCIFLLANSTSTRLSAPSLHEPRSAISLGFRPTLLAVANNCYLWLSLCSVVRRTLAWLKFCPSPTVDFVFTHIGYYGVC